MEIRDYWLGADHKERKRFLQAAKTSQGYVEKLCGGNCCPSLEMAERLIKASRSVITYEGFLAARRRKLRWRAKRRPGQGKPQWAQGTAAG